MKDLMFLMLICLQSCVGSKEQPVVEGLGSLDPAPDSNIIVFSYFKKDVSEIYLSNLNGTNLRKVVTSTNDTSFVFPKFSSNGKKILFIAFPEGGKSSNIFVSDLHGENRKQITFQSSVITDAIFSKDGSSIYYCKASDYKHYSPIGRNAPNNYEIFAVDLSTSIETQITDLRAYSISGLTRFKNNDIVARLESGAYTGLIQLPIDNAHNFMPLSPINKPRRSDLYAHACYSPQLDKLIFTAPYEIYLMDPNKKIANLIYRPADTDLGHISNVAFVDERRILFRKAGDGNAFRSVNLDGSDLELTTLLVK